MGGADVLSDIVENARGVFVRRPQFTRRVKRGERRLRLDRELVERNMLAGFRQDITRAYSNYKRFTTNVGDAAVEAPKKP